MTVSTPRRRPGRVLLRLLTIVVAATAALALPSLAAPSLAAAAAPTLTGHWTFDEGIGNDRGRQLRGQRPADARERGVVGPGHRRSALAGGQHAQPAVRAERGPVIDTTQSFTVSAWVYLTSTSGYQTFVSQDGTQISGFFLQLRADTGRFAFTRPAYDSPKALGIIASAPNIIPQPNEWYHLAGVYDAARQTISLYVNGALQQTQSYVPNWGATGPLAVGRGFFNSATIDFVSGDIDDVRTYAGALGASAISQLAGPGRLSVDASQRGPAINPTQFGEFLEEINHSGDGGLYAELIRNRDLKESSSSPVAWSEVGAPGTDASISLDSSQPSELGQSGQPEAGRGQRHLQRPGRRGQRRLLGHPGQAVDHLQGVLLRPQRRGEPGTAHGGPGEQLRPRVGLEHGHRRHRVLAAVHHHPPHQRRGARLAGEPIRDLHAGGLGGREQPVVHHRLAVPAHL